MRAAHAVLTRSQVRKGAWSYLSFSVRSRCLGARISEMRWLHRLHDRNDEILTFSLKPFRFRERVFLRNAASVGCSNECLMVANVKRTDARDHWQQFNERRRRVVPGLRPPLSSSIGLDYVFGISCTTMPCLVAETGHVSVRVHTITRTCVHSTPLFHLIVDGMKAKNGF